MTKYTTSVSLCLAVENVTSNTKCMLLPTLSTVAYNTKHFQIGLRATAHDEVTANYGGYLASGRHKKTLPARNEFRDHLIEMTQ